MQQKETLTSIVTVPKDVDPNDLSASRYSDLIGRLQCTSAVFMCIARASDRVLTHVRMIGLVISPNVVVKLGLAAG